MNLGPNAQTAKRPVQFTCQRLKHADICGTVVVGMMDAWRAAATGSVKALPNPKGPSAHTKRTLCFYIGIW